MTTDARATSVPSHCRPILRMQSLEDSRRHFHYREYPDEADRAAMGLLFLPPRYFPPGMPWISQSLNKYWKCFGRVGP